MNKNQKTARPFALQFLETVTGSDLHQVSGGATITTMAITLPKCPSSKKYDNV